MKPTRVSAVTKGDGQVVDKCHHPDNRLESSGSAMLVYVLNEGVNAGHLDASYRDTALSAWNGLVDNMVGSDSTGPVIRSAQGMSIQQSYADYVGIERLSN